MKIYVRSLVAGIFLAFSASAIAVGEGILSDEDGLAAEPEALLAEVAVFKGIREGLTLTFALCDIDIGCDPAASDSEVKQLLSALDQRIDGLTQRQQNSEDSGLDDVLIAYFDEREGFSEILEKLGGSSESGSAVVGENIDEADLFGEDESEAEATAETEADSVEQFNDMFADEDEEL